MGYTIYGDYAQENPPARIIDAVGAGDIDVAIVWGPFADQPFRQVPPGGTGAPPAPESELRPGPAIRQPPVKNPYAGDAQAIAQGRKVYQAFNCVGCYFAGGGASDHR